jgi:hypothetical protein
VLVFLIGKKRVERSGAVGSGRELDVDWCGSDLELLEEVLMFEH